jgi:UDP-glucose 4-epimerase
VSILVAGGAGYIGSITAEELLAAGREVVVYDNLSRGHRAAVPRGAAFVQGDLGDAATLRAALRDHRVTAVMHFAAHSLVPESMTNPSIYFHNNVEVGRILLDAMVSEGVPFIVFSSTCATYGEPETVPIHEDLPQRPTNPYGESKRMFERMLEWYHRIHGVRHSILRYFNAAGASEDLGEDHRPETHLIPLVLAVAQGKRASVAVFGDDYPTRDGTCIRDYIHIRDLAQAHLLALAKKAGETTHYNLGNGEGYSVREVIDACRRVTGHAIPEVLAPRRPGDPPVLIGASEKARRELGWTPRFPSLDAIVESAWAWHRRHPDGYPD